jgi:hypothetical protein
MAWWNLFSRQAQPAPPEAKASPTGALMALSVLHRPVWNRRSFRQIAEEGYQRNVIVYACTWFVARAAASVPLEIVKAKADGSMQEAQNPDLAALLHRPNPVQDGASWLQATISDMMLAGEVFLERVDLSGRPRELYRRRPDCMTPVAGNQGWPEAYEFRQGNGAPIRWPFDPVRGVKPILHLRDYSPVDDWRGLSPLDPAAFAIDAHSSAEAWSKALLENSARPSGALVYAPKDGEGKLSDEQFARLKIELDQNFSGSANAGRPLLLDGGLDWKAMGLSPADMDFVNGKNSSARDIALAMGVPPMMLGIPGDNTYANYQEANKAFYRQTVLPILGQVCRGLSWWIGDAFGDVAIRADTDDLPVFADERAADWQRIQATDFLTINEKREALGLKPITGGDQILVPSSMIPLESAGQALAGGPADDGLDDATEDDATA